jgi:phage/plasmid-like protein (TIGR03299 family)
LRVQIAEQNCWPPFSQEREVSKLSQETQEWLSTQTLIGFTEKRGNAWHYRQGDKNHYKGAIPEDDVLKRLFAWEVCETPLRFTFNGRSKTIPNQKAMYRSDNGDVLGIFKDSYQGHGYQEWLLDNVKSILSSELAIGSAGLLKNGAQAWVSIEMEEMFKSEKAGVEFRPHLLACTSFDGSIATTYKRCIQVVVCDNTLSAGMSEKGQTYKLKHTKYSAVKIGDARDALAIIFDTAEDFEQELNSLVEWEVSDKDFEKVLDILVPVPEDEKNKRGITVAEKKRDEIMALYGNDDRAAQWNGTAFGALQAFNTWNHHFAQVRKGAPRVVRNMENVVSDKMGAADNAILTALQQVAA